MKYSVLVFFFVLTYFVGVRFAIAQANQTTITYKGQSSIDSLSDAAKKNYGKALDSPKIPLKQLESSKHSPVDSVGHLRKLSAEDPKELSDGLTKKGTTAVENKFLKKDQSKRVEQIRKSSKSTVDSVNRLHKLSTEDPKKISQASLKKSTAEAEKKLEKTSQYSRLERIKKSKAAGKAKDAEDALKQAKSSKLDSAGIMNNKYLKKYYDSLKKAVPTLPQGPSQKSFSRQEMVKAVNQKFFEEEAVKHARDSASQLQSAGTKETDKLDISKYNQSTTKDLDLSPMRGYMMKSKYLSKIDSIRKINLKQEGLQYHEKATKSENKLVALTPKVPFWRKGYFEGIAGVSKSDLTILQFSPSFGYHIKDMISVGAGPNILFKSKSSALQTVVGLRAFTKFEFFQRHLYAQVEDNMQPHTMNKEGDFFNQHILLVGGGYVLPFTAPLTINISLLRKIYSNGDAMANASPWVFRIGISTIKSKK